MAYIFVGLGNPGEEYEATRHNAGRIALDYARKKFDFSEWVSDMKLKALVSKGKIGKKAGKSGSATFVMPETFMNKSGDSVKPLKLKVKKDKKSGIASVDGLVVIHDDLDLPLGRVKVSFNKSAGGHRGVASIVKAVGTEGFVRIRIGISPVTGAGNIKKPASGDVVDDFIVAPFKSAELDLISKEVAKKVSEAIDILVTDGLQKAMTTVNQM